VRLVDDILPAGVLHRAALDGSTLPSGVYLVRLTSDSRNAVQKIVLMK
jgi:hypothetical protein